MMQTIHSFIRFIKTLGFGSAMLLLTAESAMAQSRPKTVLITGAASGIGKATALAFVERGYVTYATDKDISDMAELEQKGCRIAYIDVTKEEVMLEAIRKIEAESGGINILVNNAGYGQNGIIEELSIQQIRDQFEVNVFGLLRMTQLVLPKMRERKSGRIINVGSVGGEFTTPGASAYHASKWALESFNDGLRGELRQFGIDVVLIKPGGVYTNFMNTANRLYPEPIEEAVYDEFREKFLHQSNAMFDPAKRTYGILSPEQVAAVIVKSAEKKKPKTRYRIGALAKITPKIKRLKTDRGFDRFLLKQFNVYGTKGESLYP